MRAPLAVLLLASAAVFGTAALAEAKDSALTSSAAAPVATCSSIIGEATGPRVGGYRLVLGRVSVPPAFLEQPAVPLPAGSPWPYWHKAGMVVRSGRKRVTITVPAEWRSKVAIGWGSARSGHTAVVFEACPDRRARWFAYAGGFYLASPTICAPLTVKVGERSRVTRFGIGTRCE